MTELTVGTLQKICEKLPSDYTVNILTSKDNLIQLSDIIEIKIADGTLILKE